MSTSVPALTLITRALTTLNVIAPGETPDAVSAQLVFDTLNELVDQWTLQALTVTLVTRTVYPLTAGQGGPTNPYTIGPGGNFDTTPQPRPDVIQHATLLLQQTPYVVELPLALLTDAQYAAQPIKTIGSAYPSTLYYQRTVPLGQIQLWNIPNTSVNSLVLYLPLYTTSFPDYTTYVVLPPGYQKALRLCLADACTQYFSVPPAIAQTLPAQAWEALNWVKTTNASAMMADLVLDTAYTPAKHGVYVIQTDQGA
jgi:hypothetical protein